MAASRNFTPWNVLTNPRGTGSIFRNNNSKITITVSNMAGDTREYHVATNLWISNLNKKIIEDGLVEGNVADVRLVKEPQIAINNFDTIRGAGVVDGDTLHVLMDVAGGKRSRRKSHRRRKSRGKKSRKH